MIFSFALICNNETQLRACIDKLEAHYQLICVFHHRHFVSGFYQKNTHYKSLGSLEVTQRHIHYDDHCYQWIAHSNTFSDLFADPNLTFESKAKAIDGPFCLFNWNKHSQTFHAACDALGQYTLHYSQVENGFVCASEASFIAVLKNEVQLNSAALSCWLAGHPNPNMSLFKHIHTLPFAHYLTASTDGIQHKPYWELRFSPTAHTLNDNEAIEQFHTILKNAVAHNIGNDNLAVVSQMSGGLDSSSVTALAALFQKQHNNALFSLSHYYEKSPESDESELIDILSHHIGCDEHHWMAADKEAYRDFLSLYPTDFDSPGTVLSSRYFDEFALCERHNASLLLTGNGGDEMCWGHSSVYSQRFLSGDLGVVYEVFKACRKTGMSFVDVAKKLFLKPLLPTAFLKAVRSKSIDVMGDRVALPTWLPSNTADTVKQSLNINNPFDSKKQPVHFARYHTVKTSSTFNSLRSYQKVGAAHNIKVAHPFFDKHIAQFSFDVKPKQLIRGPFPKWLLRSAMNAYLPEKVCWNTKKTTFDQHFTGLVRENATAIRQLLRHEKLADLGLLEPKPLLQQFDHVVNNASGYVTVDLLYAILTQCWITQHHSD